MPKKEKDYLYHATLPEVEVKPDTYRTIWPQLKGLWNKGLGGYLLSRCFPQADMIIHDVANNAGQHISRAFGLQPRQHTFTENDFSNNFLNYLDSVSIANLDKKVPNWRERTANGDTVRIAIDGNDYMPIRENGEHIKYGLANTNPNAGGTTLKEKLFTNYGRLENTFGKYNVEATKDKLRYTDTYDFNGDISFDPINNPAHRNFNPFDDDNVYYRAIRHGAYLAGHRGDADKETKEKYPPAKVDVTSYRNIPDESAVPYQAPHVQEAKEEFVPITQMVMRAFRNAAKRFRIR